MTRKDSSTIRVPNHFIQMLQVEKKMYENTLYDTLSRLLRQRNMRIKELEERLK